MARKKIVFVIVEGVSEQDALGAILSNIYDKDTVWVQVLRKDITSEYGVDPSNILSKLGQFANKFKVDAENGSEISQREIQDENKRVLSQVREVQSSTAITRGDDDFKPEDLVSNPTVTVQSNDFGFDF